MSKWIKQDFKVEMWGCDERTDNGYARTKMENLNLYQFAKWQVMEERHWCNMVPQQGNERGVQEVLKGQWHLDNILLLGGKWYNNAETQTLQ